MARLAKADKRQARTTSRAEFAPQIKQKRRGLHGEVKALRSEEAPLQSGLTSAAQTIRHSNLSGLDKAEQLQSIAGEQAAVPASIVNQEAGARETAHGEISDLQTSEAQSRASILAGLLTQQAEHAQSVQDEIAAEGRGNASALSLAEQEKQLGLGTYNQTPSVEEKAAAEKDEAETQHLEANGGLTPSEARTVHNEHEERHSERQAAQLSAKKILEGAKEGAIEGLPSDPKEWTAANFQELVPGVVALAKKYGTEINTTDAQHAVGAIEDHFKPQVSGQGGFGLIHHAAQLAATAVNHPSSSPAALLKLLAPASAPGY